MCRNITPLRGLEPAATDEEIEAAALQYVRKVGSISKPSPRTQAAIDRAVVAVAAATRDLLAELPHIAPAWGLDPNPPSWHMSAWQWQNTYGERPIEDTLSALIFDNLFGRFPDLMVLAAEFGASWVPHFVQHMDKSRGMGRNGPWIGGPLPPDLHQVWRWYLRRFVLEHAFRFVKQTLGWTTVPTVILSVALAFLFGYALTMRPVLRAGVSFRAAIPVALAADTLSIAVMELVDNAFIVAIPGAMEAGLTSLLFWGTLAAALAIAFVVTVPVNKWTIARGRGHAVVHRYHH